MIQPERAGDSLANIIQVNYWATQKMSFTGALYLLCRTLSLVACCIRIPSKSDYHFMAAVHSRQYL